MIAPSVPNLAWVSLGNSCYAIHAEEDSNNLRQALTFRAVAVKEFIYNISVIFIIIIAILL